MKKLFLSVLIFTSTVCWGGGTTVRNGGGMGEMLAVMTFQKMHRYLSRCLVSQNPCQLSSIELQKLKSVVDSILLEYQSFQLEFYPSNKANDDFRTGAFVGSPISLRSGALADELGNPYDIQKIGSLVLRALLAHHGGDISNLSQKVFANANSQVSDLGLNYGQLHVVKFRLSSQLAFDEIAYEQADRSYDVGSLIYESSLCQNGLGLNFQVIDLIRPFPTIDEVIIAIKWNCGGNKFGRAKIKITMAYDLNKQLDLAKSQAVVFAVQSPQ